MRQLGSVYAPLRHFTGNVSIVEWTSADAFPDLGPAVGVDTETELITATCSAPPLVVLGVFDAAHSVCYIVYWKDAPSFMRELCRRDVEQRYFNLGFDEQVLDNEDPDRPLLTAVDSGRVRDMQIRVHLHEIATTGYIRYNLNSLAGCTAHFEGFQLDKGDGTENSARLSFRRSNPDGTPYRLTDEQVRYLPFDCIATWCLGEAVRPVPTEEAHTKGMVVLAHITSNGVPVDRTVYAAMEGKLKSDRDRYRDELISYGFPDPDRDDSKEAADMKARLETAVNSLLEAGGLDRVAVQVQKVNIRLMLVYAYCHETFADEVNQCLSDMAVALSSLKRKSLTRQESDLWKRICEDHEIVAFDSSKRAVVMQALAAVFLEHYASQLRDGSARAHGFNFTAAMEAAGQFVDSHPHWMSPEVRVGPRKFFQQHVRDLLDSHPGLQLDTTEKSGEVRLTLKDMWRLQDLGISDPFLLSYTRFNHCVKYLSTYMNHDYVKDDGKVHARYVSILRTARTSCNSPNLQQLPSRDKEYELKLMYRAPEGMLLCSTDYSFVELCAFGQACYTRFGFSVMRDVINAGLDPHRWFAGVMNKIITPDLSGKDDAKWVTDLKAYLKAHVTDQQRQLAKFANFGQRRNTKFVKR